MTFLRRIVLVTETAYPEIGGGETQVRTMADMLVARGFQVTLVTRRSRRDSPAREVIDQVEIVRVPPAGPGRWKKWGLTFSVFPALLRAAGKADAVLVCGFRIVGAPTVVAARLRGTPVILKGDSRGEMSGEFFRAGLAQLDLAPQSLLVRPFLGVRNAILRRADAFVTLSTEMTDEFVNNGIPRTRVAQIPNGVDVERFRPATHDERLALRARLGLPQGPIAVFTGRLVSTKGLPHLLEAWKSVVHQRPDATLILVGEGGGDIHACEAELHAFVHEHGLESAVRFTGAVSNVEDYLRAADFFLFPTLDEAFGLSLVEAMACGLPVASTSVGGIRDFLVDGANGIVFPPGDEDALRTAIIRLITGGPEVEALGRAARETAVSRFSRAAVADALIHLVDSLGSART